VRNAPLSGTTVDAYASFVLCIVEFYFVMFVASSKLVHHFRYVRKGCNGKVRANFASCLTISKNLLDRREMEVGRTRSATFVGDVPPNGR
jgi:hypothetical protein